MTINQAIMLVDRLKPNQYGRDLKTKWLSKLDGQIYAEVLCTHEGNPLTEFWGYDNAAPETVLLVPYPYDEDIYNYYLQAMIDRENGEITKYNQAITLYNNAYQMYQNWYNRTHPALRGKRFRF